MQRAVKIEHEQRFLSIDDCCKMLEMCAEVVTTYVHVCTCTCTCHTYVIYIATRFCLSCTFLCRLDALPKFTSVQTHLGQKKKKKVNKIWILDSPLVMYVCVCALASGIWNDWKN